MELSPKTRIDDLLKTYPFLLDYLVGRSTAFSLLKNPVMRKTVGKMATLAQASALGAIPIETLLADLAAEIRAKTGSEVAVNQEGGGEVEALADERTRQAVLKGIIRDLHKGVDMTVLKKRFHELIKDIDASEIAHLEQQLMNEGMPESEVRRLCDVHVEVFKESLSQQDVPSLPPGHPISTFMLENRAAEGIVHELGHVVAKLNDTSDKEFFKQHQAQLASLVEKLWQIDLHYLRKENQLFPILEKHSITAPSQVMWALHDDIRTALKSSRAGVRDALVPDVFNSIKYAMKSITDMIYKEEHILFPMAKDLLTDEEWLAVRSGEAEVGYAWISPGTGWMAGAAPSATRAAQQQDLPLDTGRLSLTQLNLMLKHLPIDISFVNKQDEVLYYSALKERLFPRSPGVIGRKVQNCHPPKSMNMVQKILDEFKAGRRDTADFWIQMKGRFILIRYFAVRDDQGVYQGTLEVSQDVTDIKKLEGQKRLLDWD
jgi:DUF438 domain-containing protein